MTQDHLIDEGGAEPERRRPRGVIARLQSIPPAAVYILAIVVANGFSFITIPITSHYVSPTDFGRLEIATVVVEAITIIAGLGIGAQLIRFASIAETKKDAETVARQLLGNALVCFLILAAVTQLMAAPIANAFDIDLSEAAFRIFVLSGCTTALVELPIMWYRLRDRAWAYFAVVSARTVIGFIANWSVLASGYGVEGLMISNGLMLIISAIIIAGLQWRETGAETSTPRFRQTMLYSAPIVGGGIAMFMLNNANRLFMAGSVDEQTIGYFGMANRFAIAIYFVYLPFELWWLPKRIAMLREKDGLRRSAEYWGLGVSFLLLSGGAVALTAPIFVELAMPPEYAPAADFVGPMVVASMLLYLIVLTNVGTYARETGFNVLIFDSIGAAVAVIALLQLIPVYGAWGAIIAMIIGNLTRLGLYLYFGRAAAPIPYPWIKAAIGATATTALVYFAPDQEDWLWRLIYSAVGGLCLVAFLASLRLMRPIEQPAIQFARSVLNVR